MSNWKQELKAELIGIPDLNYNEVVISFHVDTYDPFSATGSSVTSQKIQRTVVIGSPKQVDARMIDGKNYVSGDLIMPVAFLVMVDAMKPLSSDPVITIGGHAKTLTDLRPYSPDTCGIIIGKDTVTLGGREYKIANIAPAGWLDGEPSSYTITARR